MKQLTLEETLKARKKDLWIHYKNLSSKSGKGYLLFLPDDGLIKNKVTLVLLFSFSMDLAGLFDIIFSP